MSKKDLKSDEDPPGKYKLVIQIPHTEPKTPFIVGVQSGFHQMISGGPIPMEILRIQLINRAIFLKSEFAKESFRIIEECYQKYARVLKDGKFLVKPWLFYPALKQIDLLLFELGSILDFFAREINQAYSLRIRLRNVTFSRVVKVLKKKHDDLPITEAVLEFDDSELHNYFRKMRNMITHRLPYQTLGQNTQLFFPDDPDSDEVTPKIENKIDVYETCRMWLNQILTFVDRTSVLVFQEMANLKMIDNETGKELTVDEFYEKMLKEE